MARQKRKNNHSRPHRDSKQVLYEMNRLAQESRMAERSAETASAVLCLYVTMQAFGWKQKRLTDLANDVSGVLADVWDGVTDFETIRQKVRETVASEYCDLSEYTLDQITGKRGSYEWFLDAVQIDPQNRINRIAVQYQMATMYCLIARGYGRQRIGLWCDKLDEVISEYQVSKKAIGKWRNELYNIGGIMVENPRDPLTGSTNSVMTGMME